MKEAQDSPESSNNADAQNGHKRKRDENGSQSQPRAKRNRYISIACNECKRRKIKCNGQSPCQRCGNLNLECLYAPNCCNSNFKDSAEFKDMTAQITSLQNQVDALFDNLNSLRSTLGHDVPNLDPNLFSHGRGMGASQASMVETHHPNRNSFKNPPFQGPASSAFGIGVAKSSLKNMGITGPEDGNEDGPNSTENGTPTHGPLTRTHHIHPAKDPLWALSKAEALRLCNVYEEECGVMYPFLDISRTIQHAGMLYTFLDAASRSGLMQGNDPGVDAMYDDATDTLKLVLAIAMVCEAGGQTDMSTRLSDSVCTSAEHRLLADVNIKAIKVLTLTAIYHFQSDDEALSWRVIGLTARLCLELGLHRSETYANMFKDEKERIEAIKLFWSIYVLDRRWSFGTGMSFALQDNDIDSAIPKPNDASPYLSAMISYSHISSQVWKSIISTESNASREGTFKKEEMSYLDYQVINWQRSIPESLKYVHPDSPEHQRNPLVNEVGGRAIYRLRLILYLRCNQMRIMIYRPVLHSATSILSSASSHFAHTVIDVAKDTVRVLTHINQTSDVYRTQQMCFNYFLLSALAVLFLAVSHAPAQFSEACRDEFYMALDLVRGLSGNSHVSKRLWRTIRGLKEIGPKLGLYARNGSGSDASGSNSNPNSATLPTPHQKRYQAFQAQQQHSPLASLTPDAHSSAAMAMAGLAGHPVDESVFFAAAHQQHGGQGQAGNGGAQLGSPTTSSASASGTSPNGMANELTHLYEAAGVYGNLMGGANDVSGGGTGVQHQQQGQMADGTSAPGGYGSDVSSPETSRMGVGQQVAMAHNQPYGGAIGMAWGNEEEFSRIMREMF